MTDTAVSEAAQRITLTVPGERRYIGIVRLFVGGLAARVDLGYETMDDLQLAIESVLGTSASTHPITLEANVAGNSVSILVGPLDRDPLQADGSRPEPVELERLLSALVSGGKSISRDGACWVRLDVRIPAGSGSA